ncbi:xanthine dehydrogenase accessory protein XdhC [Pigmentiphaga sp. NML080357]|uniref:xanthine dehydrogenase accessory protein XdhC n=1 Tax=Pigmentiphaga sp. NML080357 TaxID=2008675 RepID=UPI000B407A01|nr:xanthine dehydrogenase accessory protein XdhC [Pigmentiphaga sp. NML080357]OVZ54744.1 xanthine dehydrogenase accessory protein XdhC [Pigmentiphaga sp. NML080357]
MTGAALLPDGLVDFARAAGGRPLCLVRILDVRGSVPRGTDAALLVGEHGFAGTIGGGHLEYEAIRYARKLLRQPAEEDADAPAHTRRFALGPSLGQCCGGSVELGFSLLRDPAAALPMLAAMEPRPHQLWLYGAGHVARALVHVMLPLPFLIRWIDTREDVFPHPLPPQVEPVQTDDPPSEAACAPPGALHLIMTHSHALDFDIVRAVLERGGGVYCGLIGSATKRTTFERRLRARGMDDALIARLTCPVGLPQLTGKLPGIIAVSVAAQLLEAVEARAGAGQPA